VADDGEPVGIVQRRAVPVVPIDIAEDIRELLESSNAPLPWVYARHSIDQAPETFGYVVAVVAAKGELWLVRGWLRSVAGRTPVLSQATIEHATDPDRDVTGAVVRDIRFDEIRNAALRELRVRADSLERLRRIEDLDEAVTQDEADAASSAAQRAGDTRGRRALPTSHYRGVALRYLELVDDGRRDILNALCEAESKRLGEPVKRERVRQWLRRCVDLGYLQPAGKRGVAGRLAGPNLTRKERNA
jgi:hypothetical protein